MRCMSIRFLSVPYLLPAARAGLLSSLVMLAACTPTPTIDERDSFTQQGATYSRSFSGSSQAACEAGRRSLLGQGYVIDKVEPNRVSGHKNYQDKENDNQHAQILFNVDCTPSGDGNTIVYVSALRDLYTMKKSSNSASVGLSVLGAVSMPVGSSDDSLVKTSSETISRSEFYDGFFKQLQQNLPSANAAINAGTTPAKPAATNNGGGKAPAPAQPVPTQPAVTQPAVTQPAGTNSSPNTQQTPPPATNSTNTHSGSDSTPPAQPADTHPNDGGDSAGQAPAVTPN